MAGYHPLRSAARYGSGGAGYHRRFMTVDTLKRPLRDLRISVTDRCNFRCTYCMPKEIFSRDFEFLGRDQLLTFEEIERLVRLSKELGVHKVRITGGEPLLRRDLEHLIAALKALGDLELTMTTNGALLARKAQRLTGDDREYLALVRLEMSAVDQLRRIYTLSKRIAKVVLPPALANQD